MSAAEIGQFLGLALTLLALVQAGRTIYQSFRERDAALVEWGKQVIDMMCDMEAVFSPFMCDQDRRKEAFLLSIRAGKLLDQGRLFFRNVSFRSQRHGFRVLILDQIVKSSYVVSKIAYCPDSDLLKATNDESRLKLWNCRREFVKILQSEMKYTLKRRKKNEIGESIDSNPSNWPTPDLRPWWRN